MGIKEVPDLKDLVEGSVLLVNKPLFWTSFDVVKKVKAIIEKTVRQHYEERKRVKVGHAGTLDPLAEGLMVLCTGRKTKILNTIQAAEKEYVTTMEFGKTTPSFDLETMFDREYTLSKLNRNNIEDTISKFTGEIDQVPPQYSAKSVKGRRAYKAARMGETTELKSSRIYINSIEILHYAWPVLTIRVVCSKGTYIRALARDIGEYMDTGAHIIGLKRTRIGDHHIKDAFSLEKFEQKIRYL